MGRMRRMNRGGRVKMLNAGGESGAAAFTPAVETGVPQGGFAQDAISNYFGGVQPGGGASSPYAADAGIGQGVSGTSVAPSTPWTPPAPPAPPPVAPPPPAATGGGGGGGGTANVNYGTARGSDVNTTGNAGGNNTVYDTKIGGSSGGLGFGAAGGVQNSVANAPGTILNIPTWGQESKRVDQQVADHGFTTEQVQDAASTLAGGTDLEGFTDQGQFQAAAGIPGEVTSTAVDAQGNEVANDKIDWNAINAPNIENTGGAADVQHANLDATNAAYAEALRAIPNDGTATQEQRVAAAAANPAYNAEAAKNHSQVAAGVGNWGPLGFTKKAENLTTDDFNYVANQNFKNNDSQKNTMNQYGLAGLSAAGAGIRNIGGANAQGGDNQGLPMDYMVLGDGTVYGPGGSEFGSVAEAQADAGETEQAPQSTEQPTALDNFLGQFVDTGVNSKYGTAGSRTEAQQATFDDFHSGRDQSTVTGQKGQASGQAAAATKQADAYVDEQAQIAATATAEEQAANEQDQLLGDFLWKYEGADNSQMKANYAKQAKAAGLDFGGMSHSDFATSDAVAGKDKDKLKADAKAAMTARNRGFNMGGQVGPIGLNMGGDPEEEKRRAAQSAAKIASSRAASTPLPPPKPMNAPGPQQSQSPLAGIGMKVGKMALSSALGPLGGILGGLFNEGGNVPMLHLNQGGWLSSLFGGGDDPKKKRSKPLPEGFKSSGSYRYEGKHAGGSGLARDDGSRARTERSFKNEELADSYNNRGASQWTNFKKAFGFNDGGMLDAQMMGPLGNPNGYNEGGSVVETPMKKVMDEDKIAMAREAFEMAEGRKDEKFMFDEERAAEKHLMEMKMKRKAAMTKTAPLAAK